MQQGIAARLTRQSRLLPLELAKFRRRKSKSWAECFTAILGAKQGLYGRWLYNQQFLFVQRVEVEQTCSALRPECRTAKMAVGKMVKLTNENKHAVHCAWG